MVAFHERLVDVQEQPALIVVVLDLWGDSVLHSGCQVHLECGYLCRKRFPCQLQAIVEHRHDVFDAILIIKAPDTSC